MEPIHERMPVILQDEESQQLWLKGPASVELLHALCRPLPLEGWQSFRVDKKVNKPGYEGPACMEALKEEA